MNRWAARLAAMASGGAALLVLVLYSPSLQAPFLVPKRAALELTASLGLVSFALQRATSGGPRWDRAVTLGALLVLATSALAWAAAAAGSPGAPYAVDAMARWGSLLGLACAASVIADLPDAPRRLLETVTIAATVVAGIGLLQHLELAPFPLPVISKPGSTFGNRNFAAEVMAMSLPLGVGAVAGARRRGSRAALLGALALEMVFLAVTRARGAWFGAACGLGMALWLGRRGLNRTVIIVAVAVAGIAGIAAAVPGRVTPHDAADAKRYSGMVEVLEQGVDTHSTALRTRLGLWRRTLAMVRDHPLLGVGPGNWPVVFPLYAEPGAARDGVLSATRAPRQAHDDLLERAAETGLPGLLALGALGVGAFLAARRRIAEAESRVVASAAASALVALVGLSLTGFPLEMPGTLALAGLSLGLVASDPRAPSSSPRSPVPAFAALCAALAVLPLVVVRAVHDVRGSAWLGAAERAMQRDRGPAGATEVLDDLKRALDVRPVDFRAELHRAQMLLWQQRAIDSGRAAQAALAIEPNSPNGWAALAAAELTGDDLAGARRHASRALTLLEDYPWPLDVRARAAERSGDLDAARLDRERIVTLASGPANDDTTRAARKILAGAP